LNGTCRCLILLVVVSVSLSLSLSLSRWSDRKSAVTNQNESTQAIDLAMIGSSRSSFSPQCRNISEISRVRSINSGSPSSARDTPKLALLYQSSQSPLAAARSLFLSLKLRDIACSPCRCVCSCAVCSATHMAAHLPPMRAHPTGRRCHSAAAVLLSVLCFVVALAWCANVPSDQRTRFGRLRVAQWGQRSKRRLCLGAALMNQSRWQGKLSWTSTPPPMAPSG